MADCRSIALRLWPEILKRQGSTPAETCLVSAERSLRSRWVGNMENLGIDPSASRMLSERSTV